MLSDLSDQEWNSLHTALMAPSLWRFAIVAATDGYGQAVEACRSGLSERAVKALEDAGYDPVLPPYEDMQRLLTACKVRARREPRESVEDVGRRLGIGEKEACAAMVVWCRYTDLPERYRARVEVSKRTDPVRKHLVVDSAMLGGLQEGGK